MCQSHAAATGASSAHWVDTAVVCVQAPTACSLNMRCPSTHAPTRLTWQFQPHPLVAAACGVLVPVRIRHECDLRAGPTHLQQCLEAWAGGVQVLAAVHSSILRSSLEQQHNSDARASSQLSGLAEAPSGLLLLAALASHHTT